VPAHRRPNVRSATATCAQAARYIGARQRRSIHQHGIEGGVSQNAVRVSSIRPSQTEIRIHHADRRCGVLHPPTSNFGINTVAGISARSYFIRHCSCLGAMNKVYARESVAVTPLLRPSRAVAEPRDVVAPRSACSHAGM
jgi:hypothetical protein